MRASTEGSTVLVSDADGAAALAARLSTATGGPACYASLAELAARRPLASVAILVLLCRPLPRGTQLVALGRMHVEFPGIQTVAVLGEQPPLEIAEFLTACGVDLIMDGSTDEGTEQVASTVHRMHERTRWIAS